MIREIRTGGDFTTFNKSTTKGLGEIKLYHPTGTFGLTPASNILIQAIINNQGLLHGTGIDWGCGVGCLAIFAARMIAVNKVYGLDIAQPNIHAATKNAEDNALTGKVRFMLADSYQPFNFQDRSELEKNKGKLNFILANPPSSIGDDGFAFRRLVLTGAKDYLCNEGIVLLNISFQYGKQRIESLYKSIEGFSYMGIAASTDYVPFDLSRPDLFECLKIYADEEQKGGFEYTFGNEGNDKFLNAKAALKNYMDDGRNPLTKWQTHIFKYQI